MLLPADPKTYDLAVVYGGPQLLTDLQPDEAFLLEEVAWVKANFVTWWHLFGAVPGRANFGPDAGGKISSSQGRAEVAVVYQTLEKMTLTRISTC